MKRTLAIAAGAMAVLFVIGVDLLHCILLGAGVITVGLLVQAMQPVEEAAEPDPLPVPYTTTLLRPLTFTDPRSADPLGDTAGRRAWQVCHQATIDFPDDPELGRFADRAPDEWRFLEQRELVRLLDRVDELTRTARPGLRRSAVPAVSDLTPPSEPTPPPDLTLLSDRPEETR